MATVCCNQEVSNEALVPQRPLVIPETDNSTYFTNMATAKTFCAWYISESLQLGAYKPCKGFYWPGFMCISPDRSILHESGISFVICNVQTHSLQLPGKSKKCPAFVRQLLPEYISNDIWQYLIEYLTCSIIFRNFPR